MGRMPGGYPSTRRHRLANVKCLLLDHPDDPRASYREARIRALTFCIERYGDGGSSFGPDNPDRYQDEWHPARSGLGCVAQKKFARFRCGLRPRIRRGSWRQIWRACGRVFQQGLPVRVM